jgi:hypothetical protein
VLYCCSFPPLSIAIQVLKLVSQELTFDALLEMTAVQLADTSTQQRRQQQLTNVVKDALRESTQETLENARREAAAASDVVTADIQARAAAASADFEPPVLSRASSTGSTGMDVDPSSPSQPSLTHPASLDHGDAMDTGDAYNQDISPASSRSLAIEQRVNASLHGPAGVSPRPSAVPKRPMDADAISRFTTSSARPNKAPRIETDDSVTSHDGGSASSTPRSNIARESPRVKPPSLLGNILANKAAVAAATTQAPAVVASDDEVAEAEPPRKHSSSKSGHAKSVVPAVPPGDAVKLINSTGGNELSIVRNGTMKGEAWMLDRSVHIVDTTLRSYTDFSLSVLRHYLV